MMLTTTTTTTTTTMGHVPQGLCLTLAFAIHHAHVMTTEAQTNPGSIPLSGEQLGWSEPSERIIISKGAPQRYTNLWTISCRYTIVVFIAIQVKMRPTRTGWQYNRWNGNAGHEPRPLASMLLSQRNFSSLLNQQKVMGIQVASGRSPRRGSDTECTFHMWRFRWARVLKGILLSCRWHIGHSSGSPLIESLRELLGDLSLCSAASINFRS